MTTSRQKRHGYRRRGRSLSGVALALLATISLACGRSATAGFEPSNIPQPTPDQTLDAVVRGLVSPVVYGSPPPGTLIRPAATAAVVSAPTAAPPRPAATPAAAKPGGAATPTATPQPPTPRPAQSTPQPPATSQPPRTLAPAVINPTALAPSLPFAPTRPAGSTPGTR